MSRVVVVVVLVSGPVTQDAAAHLLTNLLANPLILLACLLCEHTYWQEPVPYFCARHLQAPPRPVWIETQDPTPPPSDETFSHKRRCPVGESHCLQDRGAGVCMFHGFRGEGVVVMFMFSKL